MYHIHFYQAEECHSGIRLDVFLSLENPELSRSHMQKLICEGLVEVNSIPAKASFRLKVGDQIILRMPPPVELVMAGEDIPLDIYHNDADLIVVNKPRGMVVHPAEGNYSGTLVNALLYCCKDLSGINGIIRPGIVHRLDKDTSGLLMVAKNDTAHIELARQLSIHSVDRIYLALVQGIVKNDFGRIDAPIGRHPKDRKKMAVTPGKGRNAATNYRVLKRFNKENLTLLELILETGRTHQIRVHMKWLGHPLLGDSKYSQAKNRFGLEGQFLHAKLLGFLHPKTGSKMIFEAPLPKELEEILSNLEE
ncbi:MAG: RluA family pseudouridine synthase [Peptococcaceae bacterium]|nr:RluA family pseudouridine synthase [Peptococcaceae bacterium]